MNLLKVFAYICCLVGFIATVFGTTDEELYGGAMFMVGGVVIRVIVRIMDRIDPDGADEL